ncbi:MAG: SHOCT-like domain-containing protein [Armatimonadota bacterium]
MSEDRIRILEMLKQGKITVDEAEQLLDALQGQAGTGDTQICSTDTSAAGKPKPKYLRVVVDDNEDHVNIRVPLGLVRAGIKLGAFIPTEAQEKIQHSLSEKGLNIDLANMKADTFDTLIDSLSDLNIDVNEKDSNTVVRIFCE